MVTHSRIVVLSPISAVVTSPANFKSCGIPEITDPGKTRQFLPILAPSMITTFEPIHVPSPISTSLWITAKGSTTTLSAILACGCIYAKGCIIMPVRFLLLLLFAPSSLLQLLFFRLPYQNPSFGQFLFELAPSNHI